MYSWRVPLTVYGDLRIVALQDIGPMGPAENAWVIYHWPLYFHLFRFLPGLFLIALLFRRANRRLGAWWILVPGLIWPYFLAWLLEMTGVPSMNNLFLFIAIYEAVVPFCFGIACLWLLADKLSTFPRMFTFLQAAGLVTLAGIAGVLCQTVFDLRGWWIWAGLCIGFASLILLGTMALAGFVCRKHYSPWRFFRRFFVWLTFFGAVLFLFPGLLILLPQILAGENREGFGLFLSWLPYIAGWLLLLLLLVPFVAVALWNGVYRPRFYAIFQLPGMDVDKESETQHTGADAGEREL